MRPEQEKRSTTMETLIICSADLLQPLPSKALSVASNTFLQVPLSLTLLNIYEVLQAKHESLGDYKSVCEAYLIGSNVPKARVSGEDLKTLALSDFRAVHHYISVHFLVIRTTQSNVEAQGTAITEYNIRSVAALNNAVAHDSTQGVRQLAPNAFDLLMLESSKTGSPKDMVFIPEVAVKFRGGNGEQDARIILLRDLLAHTVSCDVRVFRRSVQKASIVFRELCTLLWKLDGHLDLVEGRRKLPSKAQRFRKFIGNTVQDCVFKNWIVQKKPTPRLSEANLAAIVTALENSLTSLLSSSYIPNTGDKSRKTEAFFCSVSALIDGVNVYLDHISDTASKSTLRRANERREALTFPTGSSSFSKVENKDTVSSGTVEPFKGDFSRLHMSLAPLIHKMSFAAMYAPIVVDFDVHAVVGTNLHGLEKQKISSKKYAAASSIRYARGKARRQILDEGLPFTMGFYKEIIPGAIGTFLALWRVPSSEESRSASRQMTAVFGAAKHARTVLSREQSRLYANTMISIGKTKGVLKVATAAALLEVFGFSSVTRSSSDDERMARALAAILGTNSETVNSTDHAITSLARDLRDSNCQKRGPLFSKFFEAAQDFLDHAVSSTGAQVDQRRAASTQGGARMYMPIAMSLPDLRDRIQKHADTVLHLKLTTDYLLPSCEWLLLQFQPQRDDTLTATKFSGLLGIHRTVQSRTIRQSHEDCHFTRALWQYIRQWCHPLAKSGHAMVVSVDDKCGVKLGEPGMPIGALQRRKKKSICATAGGAGILAADHDYSSVTLTPSVTLFIKPPEDRLGSYAQGAPFLTIKNAVFQTSNPLRHAAELAKAI